MAKSVGTAFGDKTVFSGTKTFVTDTITIVQDVYRSVFDRLTVHYDLNNNTII